MIRVLNGLGSKFDVTGLAGLLGDRADAEVRVYPRAKVTGAERRITPRKGDVVVVGSPRSLDAVGLALEALKEGADVWQSRADGTFRRVTGVRVRRMPESAPAVTGGDHGVLFVGPRMGGDHGAARRGLQRKFAGRPVHLATGRGRAQFGFAAAARGLLCSDTAVFVSNVWLLLEAVREAHATAKAEASRLDVRVTLADIQGKMPWVVDDRGRVGRAKVNAFAFVGEVITPDEFLPAAEDRRGRPVVDLGLKVPADLARHLPRVAAALVARKGKTIATVTVAVGEVVDRLAVVPVEPGDDLRDGRMNGGSFRFPVIAEPCGWGEETTEVSLVVEKAGNGWQVLACYAGPVNPPHPRDPNATAESGAFWERHAFLPGTPGLTLC